MTIQFSCECGKQYKVSDDKAGRQAPCRACGASLVVPTTEQYELEPAAEPDARPAGEGAGAKGVDTCDRCGNRTPPAELVEVAGGRLCAACHKLVEAAASSDPSGRSANFKPLIIVAVVILAVGGAGAGWYYLLGPGKFAESSSESGSRTARNATGTGGSAGRSTTPGRDRPYPVPSYESVPEFDRIDLDEKIALIDRQRRGARSRMQQLNLLLRHADKYGDPAFFEALRGYWEKDANYWVTTGKPMGTGVVRLWVEHREQDELTEMLETADAAADASDVTRFELYLEAATARQHDGFTRLTEYDQRLIELANTLLDASETTIVAEALADHGRPGDALAGLMPRVLASIRNREPWDSRATTQLAGLRPQLKVAFMAEPRKALDELSALARELTLEAEQNPSAAVIAEMKDLSDTFDHVDLGRGELTDDFRQKHVDAFADMLVTLRFDLRPYYASDNAYNDVYGSFRQVGVRESVGETLDARMWERLDREADALRRWARGAGRMVVHVTYLRKPVAEPFTIRLTSSGDSFKAVVKNAQLDVDETLTGDVVSDPRKMTWGLELVGTSADKLAFQPTLRIRHVWRDGASRLEATIRWHENDGRNDFMREATGIVK